MRTAMKEKPNTSEHPKRRAFLAAYATVGLIAPACRKAQCGRTQVYQWMKDPEFKSRMDAAREEACDTLEAEAMRRAVNGYDQPVYHKGVKCGTTRKYSDTLLMFLLKAARPYRYQDRPNPRFRENLKPESDNDPPDAFS